MAVEHYENFPVASILLPSNLRKPVEVIYAFARSADDIADEGDFRPEERLAALSGYIAELDTIERNGHPDSKLFIDLKQVILYRTFRQKGMKRTMICWIIAVCRPIPSAC